MADILFREFELMPPSDGPALIAIGERIKKGTYRPCITTIPYSTVTGALRQRYGRDDIHAVGFFEGQIERMRIEHSAHDGAIDASDLPLATEVLVNPKGKIYVLVKNDSVDLSQLFDSDRPIPILLGALKSKGLGRCQLKMSGEKRIRSPHLDKRLGMLRTRIPEEVAPLFGIENSDVLKPVYGYLFKPTSMTDGVYVRSLFEGSVVQGYHFLLRRIA